MSERIVIDSSVAIKWVVPETGSDEALRVRLTHQLFAPELIIPEIANILWKKHQRGELSIEEAAIASELLSNAGVTYISMRDLGIAATDMAITLGHPAYDCIYLATAMQLGCPFLTADARLIQKLKQRKFSAARCYDLSAIAVV